MAVLFYFSVGIENKSSTWWGANGEHCELASCPTAKGIIVDGSPVNKLCCSSDASFCLKSYKGKN
jgi:hypothetical protein